MAITYVEIAHGSATSSPLISPGIAVALEAVMHDPAQVLDYFNTAVYNAESTQPEGAWMEMDIKGWTLPIVGNVGASIAAQVNTAWRQGEITDPLYSGEKLESWPTFPNQIAWYEAGDDTLILRWRKGQPWFVWIFVFILVVIGVEAVLNWLGLAKYQYSLFHALEGSTSGNGTTTPATTGMPVWEKIAIGVGATLIIGGTVWFEAQLRLREAGASKSNQEIIVER